MTHPWLFDDLLVGFLVTVWPLALARMWHREQARKRWQATVNVVLQTTVIDATRRKHDLATPEHALRVLLDVPEIAAAWEARGWPLDEVCATLEAELAARPAGDAPRTTAVASEDLIAAVRRAGRVVAALRGGRATAGRDMLSGLTRELASPRTSSGALLAKAGALCPYDTFWLGPPDPAAEAGAMATPYRSGHAASSASVVLWNDATTKMEFVVEILTRIFGVTETRATYLTLSVHTLGRAVVGSFGPAEARDLAARATDAARARGMPLRVTIEPPS